MASKTTVNRPRQHHRVQAPQGVAVSGFTVNQFTVVPRRGADGAAPREPGTTVKSILASVSPRHFSKDFSLLGSLNRQVCEGVGVPVQ